MALSEKSSAAFSVLLDREDVDPEAFVKVLKIYPAMFGRIGADQAKRSALAFSHEGYIEGLELARKRGIVNQSNAVFYLREALIKSPKERERAIFDPQANIIYDDRLAAGPGADLLVVDWFSKSFTFAPGEVDKAVLPPCGLPASAVPLSIDAIVALDRKQPLSESSLTILLGTVAFLISKNFTNRTLGKWGYVSDLDTTSASFWDNFPILRRLANIAREETHKENLKSQHSNRSNVKWSYVPGVSFLPPGKVTISGRTAARFENLLLKTGWFLRSYQEVYGRQYLERNFEVSDDLDYWFNCASAYIHHFGNEIHGTSQVYLGKVSHQPRVGEFFVETRDLITGFFLLEPEAREVVSVEKIGDIVVRLESLAYPRAPRVGTRYYYEDVLRLEKDGSWTPFYVNWGEFRTGAGNVATRT